MKWLSLLTQAIEKIPLERLFIKPPSNKKRLEELRDILGEVHTKPAQALTENPPEEIPEEDEDLKGYLGNRQQKVHLEPLPTNGVSTEETVTYQNREIGKLLLRMERHYAQKLRINGVPCDCGSKKHLLDLESLCEETVSMVDNPDIYYRIIEWSREVTPKSTDQAAKSGQYDSEYPVFSRQARDFRKEVIGSSEPSALFGREVKEQATELPATEEERKELLSKGFIA